MTIESFTRDWLIQTGVISFVATVTTFIVQRITEWRLKQKLTEHTESLKHSLRKELMKLETNFNKKHSIYPELYSALVRAESSSLRLLGISFSRDYSNCTKDELEAVLIDNNYERAGIREFLATFDRDERLGRKEFRKAIELCNVSVAEEHESKARSFLLLNDLYLSKEVRDISTSVLKQFRKLNFARRQHIQSDFSLIEAFEDARQTKEDIEASRAIVSQINPLIRKELGQS